MTGDDVRAAVAAAPWIKPSDGAAVALAVGLADDLDEKSGARMAQALLRALGALGLTPTTRPNIADDGDADVFRDRFLRAS